MRLAIPNPRRIRMPIRVLLAALLLALPLAAGAQTRDPARRIEAARRAAQAAGLPVALLDGKVAEGRAKGVPMDRIAAAVERRLSSLTRSRDAMGAGPRGAPVSASDLSVGADALEAGVTPAALGALTTSVPGDRRAVAIAVLTQLVRAGEPVGHALARVQAASRDGADALRDLPAKAAAAQAAHPAQGRGAAGSRGHGGGPPSSVPSPGGNPHRGGKPQNPGQGHGKP
jgi:hypothetical protein